MVQRKPALDATGDRFEREADAVADRVVRGEVGVASGYGSLLRFPAGFRRPVAAGDGEAPDTDPVAAPAGVASSPPGGRPLEPALRDRMERGFGVRFGAVRVHTGAAAASASREIGARAFAFGNDLHFGAGAYRPHTPSGQRLIAHELAHTLQQERAGTLRPQRTPERVTRVIVLLRERRAVVVTETNRYPYRLTQWEGLEPGTYRWRHTHRTQLDRGSDALLERPPKVTGPVRWWIVPMEPGQPSWADFGDSEFDMQVVGSSRIIQGEGSEAGRDASGSGGRSRREGAGAGGTRSAPTDEEKRARAERFLARLGARTSGRGEPVSRESIEERVGAWTDAEMDEFFELFDQARAERPLDDMNALLEWWSRLTPSEKEILRVNRTLGASLDDGAPASLPEDVQLMITTTAAEASDVAARVEGTNRSLAAIRAAVHRSDPERARNFEPLDAEKLTAFNEMMALEALLAGASERSPEIAEMARALTGNLGRIRRHVLEELAWLAGELAATTVLAVLVAPLSGGASAAVGATRAAMLVVRLDRLRRLLDTIQRVRAVRDTLERLRAIHQRIQNASAHAGKLEAYRAKLDELLEMKRRLASDSEDIGPELHERADALEDELLELVRELIEAEGGLGEILDFLYLPEDAGEDELRRIILDLPRGLDAAREMLAYHERMRTGDLEATKVLMFKAFATGYLLYPLVGYIADLANEQLNELLRDRTLGERLTGGITRGRSRRRSSPGAANRARVGEVRPRSTPREGGRRQEAARRPEGERSGRRRREDEEDERGLSPEERAWRRLGREIRRLPRRFDDGGTQEEILREARRITRSSRYRGVAQSVGATSAADEPAWWEVTVRKRGQGAPHTVRVLKTARTRYLELRRAVTEEFRSISDANRRREYVVEKVGALRERYRVEHVRVEDQRDGDAVVGWEIQGRMGRNYQEILTIEAADQGWGSRRNPIPIDWPKPSISDYPALWIGPPVGRRTPLTQAEAAALARRPRADREAFADRHAKPENQRQLEAWKERGAPVEEYRSTERRELPAPARSTVGVTSAYQVRPGFTFQLRRQGGTPGGGKILGVLAHFGYSARGERTAGDHVVEYSMGGPDDRENLWPLDGSMNSSAGGTLARMRFPRPGGQGTVTMDRLKARSTRPGRQNEVWFRIASVRPAP